MESELRSKLIREQIRMDENTEQAMTLPVSFINEEPLYNYISLVYNVNEQKTDDQIFDSILDNAGHTILDNVLSADCYVPNAEKIVQDIPILVSSKGFYLCTDGVTTVKKARFNANNFIDLNHRYVKELTLVRDITQCETCKLHIYSTNRPDKKHHIESYSFVDQSPLLDEARDMLSILWNHIISGNEPSECEDTWNGNKCIKYCVHAKTGLCTYGKERLNASSSNE